MSTRIEHALRTLHALSYEDMVALSKAVANRLGDSRSDAVIKLADALSSAHKDFIELPDQATEQDRVLREIVGTRSRGFDIKVRRLPKGWSVSCDSFRASGVQAPTVADALVQYLDQAVVTHIMMK